MHGPDDELLVTGSGDKVIIGRLKAKTVTIINFDAFASLLVVQAKLKLSLHWPSRFQNIQSLSLDVLNYMSNPLFIQT